MKKISEYHVKHTPILTWLIIPIAICFLGLNYIVGNLNKPLWTNQSNVIAQSEETSSSKTVKKEKFKLLTDTSRGFITFWFDDAWESQYTNAMTILQREFHFTGALSVPTAAVGTKGYMNWNMIRHLDQNGWEITTHSRSHNCDTNTLTPEKAYNETFGARIDLDNQGIASDIYVTPCSSDSLLLEAYVRRSHVALRTGVGAINPVPVNDPYQLKSISIQNSSDINQVRNLIESAKTDKTWLILMFHQVDSSTGEYALTPDLFRSIVKTVADSGIPVVLPTEVLAITNVH